MMLLNISSISEHYQTVVRLSDSIDRLTLAGANVCLLTEERAFYEPISVGYIVKRPQNENIDHA